MKPKQGNIVYFRGNLQQKWSIGCYLTEHQIISYQTMETYNQIDPFLIKVAPFQLGDILQEIDNGRIFKLLQSATTTNAGKFNQYKYNQDFPI